MLREEGTHKEEVMRAKLRRWKGVKCWKKVGVVKKGGEVKEKVV